MLTLLLTFMSVGLVSQLCHVVDVVAVTCCCDVAARICADVGVDAVVVGVGVVYYIVG